MENVFWVTCPKCGKEFMVDYELRHNTEYRLICPFCRLEFFDSESPKIVDP